MKKSRLGLVIFPVIIGVLLLILSQSENNFMSDSNDELDLTENHAEPPLERRYHSILSSSGSPILGSLDAPTAIMMFSDYQCPNCKFWFDKIMPDIVENLVRTEKTNIVFIDANPQGEDSQLASEAAYCADDQGKYLGYQKILFDSQQEIDDGWASSEQLKRFASDLQLNMDSFEDCLDSGIHERKVKSNVFTAKINGIFDIPTFVIVSSDGRHHIIKGIGNYEVFEMIIDSFTK